MEWLAIALVGILVLRLLLWRYGERFFTRVIPRNVQNDPARASRWFNIALAVLILFAITMALLSRPDRLVEWVMALIPLGIILGFVVYAVLTGRLPRRFH